jgi:hypothetical protein
MKHKHADLIHAWADGAQIQWKNRHGKWEDMNEPLWSLNHEYRIKPEPKPDFRKDVTLFWNPCIGLLVDKSESNQWLTNPNNYRIYGNFRVTFDGETDEIKSVEVLR